MHSKGGHYTWSLGSGSSFVDRDCDVASAVALMEAQDGAGTPLFHRDGRLGQWAPVLTSKEASGWSPGTSRGWRAL